MPRAVTRRRSKETQHVNPEIREMRPPPPPQFSQEHCRPSRKDTAADVASCAGHELMWESETIDMIGL